MMQQLKKKYCSNLNLSYMFEILDRMLIQRYIIRKYKSLQQETYNRVSY